MDVHERIVDGWYDAGRSAQFASFETLENMQGSNNNAREVILVDSRRDMRLKDIVDKAESLLNAFSDLEAKIR